MTIYNPKQATLNLTYPSAPSAPTSALLCVKKNHPMYLRLYGAKAQLQTSTLKKLSHVPHYPQ